MKILIMGLPGSGKTTLAREIAKRIQAVHFNADEVRNNINDDLGFSREDRIKQAKRMGWLCDQVVKAGYPAIADFVCPTESTREAFGERDLMVWMHNIDESRFSDTNRIFEEPEDADLVIDYVDVNSFSIDNEVMERAVSEVLKMID